MIQKRVLRLYAMQQIQKGKSCYDVRAQILKKRLNENWLQVNIYRHKHNSHVRSMKLLH